MTVKKKAARKKAARPNHPAKKPAGGTNRKAKPATAETSRKAKSGTVSALPAAEGETAAGLATGQQSLLPDTGIEAGGAILDSQLLLPQKICALAFGVSVQALQRWPIKPRMTRGHEKLYYLPELIDFRLNRDEPGKLNLGTERARLAAAQAERTELEVEVLKGSLIPSDVILENWEPVVGAARAKVLAIPAKAKAAIPKLTDRNVARLKTICRAALEDLANGGIPKRAKANTRQGL